nr:MAG TPA: hypothetical protein [Caudoviricetes sp.]
MIQVVTLEEIDRTIYELIRKRLVDDGYLPEITNYTTEKDYIVAKKQIEVQKGFVIEVHGVGTPEARDERIVCEITIDRKQIEAGSLGGETPQFIKDNVTGKFTKEKIPAICSDVHYEIRVFSNSIHKERIAFQILMEIFTHRNYYPITETYNPDRDKWLLFTSRGSTDVSSTDVREHLFYYIAEDVWLGKLDTIRRDIAPMSSAHFWYNIQDNQGNIVDKKDLLVE